MNMLPPSKQFAVVHTATNAPRSAIIEGPAAGVLARVAHEMRQPLAAATSALQLLQEGPDNRVRQRARVVLEQQFQRLSRFIDDLLEASRLRSGTTILHIDRVDVRGLVEELVEAVGPQATAKRQRLETRLPPEALWIDADATRLQEVVSNLLANAVSYTGEGGLVSVTVTRGSGEVVVTVRDTGRGIPADQLPHLFEMFSKGDGAPNHAGLGLAIAKDLVELHGGSIRAASRGPGRGSKFVVRLPETAHRRPDDGNVA
jgi:signal transduction histidine kinase